MNMRSFSFALPMRFLAGAALLLLGPPASASIIVSQTTDPAALQAALGGTGLTIDSVTVSNGAAAQYGTYSNFSLIGNGVVMSTGNAVATAGPPSTFDIPSTDTGAPGTAEFNAYGLGNITSFGSSHNVAVLDVKFTLSQASGVAFDFIFGSIEFPNFVNSFTDSFLGFLDGTAPGNQIVFNSAGDPVSVTTNFAGSVITNNAETAFGDPHGLLPLLETTSQELPVGQHEILFEIGDVNDGILDSAVFLTNFHAAPGGGGPNTGPPSVVPELDPGSMAGALTFMSGGLLVLTDRRRRRAVS